MKNNQYNGVSRIFVNDYHESHTKVWVASVGWTITHRMNYGWGFLFRLLFYAPKGTYTSGEILVNGLLLVIRTFYACLQYSHSPL